MPLTGGKSEKTLEQQDLDSTPTFGELSGDGVTDYSIDHLHGNTLALINWLIRTGMMYVDEEAYQELVKIYNAFDELLDRYRNANEEEKESLKEEYKKKYNRFASLIKSATYVADSSCVMRLMAGDMDSQGANDFMTLLLLRHYQYAEEDWSKAVRESRFDHIRILFSSESATFIRVMSQLEKCSQKGETYDPSWIKDFGEGEIDQSLGSMLVLMEMGLFTPKNLLHVYQYYYIPKLRLVDYSIDETSGSITLYSQTDVGLDGIQQLAERLDVDYHDESIQALAETLDAINKSFAEKIKQVENIEPLLADLKNSNQPSTHNDYTIAYVAGEQPRASEEQATGSHAPTSLRINEKLAVSIEQQPESTLTKPAVSSNTKQDDQQNPSRPAYRATTMKSAAVQLSKQPEADLVQDDATEYTLGDLHGNSLLLIHWLIRIGALEPEEGQYEQLKQQYLEISKLTADEGKEHDLQAVVCKVNGASEVEATVESTWKQIEDFKKTIESLRFSAHLPVMRLIGDECADRGANDYLTLLLIKQVVKSQQTEEASTAQESSNLHILFSNHSSFFVQCMEKWLNSEAKYPDPVSVVGENTSQYNSIYSLALLVQEGKVTKQEIKELYEQYYVPCIKLLDYSIDAENGIMTLHSHAGIGLNNIEDLARKFNIEYKDGSIQALKTTIDEINQVFTQRLQDKKASDLLAIPKYVNGYSFDNIDSQTDPVVFFAWNRNYRDLVRPREKNGFQIYYVHGHDTKEPKNETNHVYCNDHNVGKANRSSITDQVEMLGFDEEAPMPVLIAHIAKPLEKSPKDILGTELLSFMQSFIYPGYTSYAKNSKTPYTKAMNSAFSACSSPLEMERLGFENINNSEQGSFNGLEDVSTLIKIISKIESASQAAIDEINKIHLNRGFSGLKKDYVFDDRQLEHDLLRVYDEINERRSRIYAVLLENVPEILSDIKDKDKLLRIEIELPETETEPQRTVNFKQLINHSYKISEQLELDEIKAFAGKETKEQSEEQPEEQSEEEFGELPEQGDLKKLHATEYSLGGVQGKSKLLLDWMIRIGAITTDFPYERYFQDGRLTQARIFDACFLKAEACDSLPIIRIGDEFDNANDFYVSLQLASKIKKSPTQNALRILLSEKGMGFIRLMEVWLESDEDTPSKDMFDNEGGEPFKQLIDSMAQLVSDNEYIDKDRLKKLYMKSYVPHLKLIDYSIDSQGRAITLYAQKPIGVNTVQGYARLLNVHYEDNTPEAFAATIDRINTAFVHQLQHKKASSCFQELMEAGADVSQPLNHKGYSINYVSTQGSKASQAQPHIHVIKAQPDSGDNQPQQAHYRVTRKRHDHQRRLQRLNAFDSFLMLFDGNRDCGREGDNFKKRFYNRAMMRGVITKLHNGSMQWCELTKQNVFQLLAAVDDAILSYNGSVEKNKRFSPILYSNSSVEKVNAVYTAMARRDKLAEELFELLGADDESADLYSEYGSFRKDGGCSEVQVHGTFSYSYTLEMKLNNIFSIFNEFRAFKSADVKLPAFEEIQVWFQSELENAVETHINNNQPAGPDEINAFLNHFERILYQLELKLRNDEIRKLEEYPEFNRRINVLRNSFYRNLLELGQLEESYGKINEMQIKPDFEGSESFRLSHFRQHQFNAAMQEVEQEEVDPEAEKNLEAEAQLATNSEAEPEAEPEAQLTPPSSPASQPGPISEERVKQDKAHSHQIITSSLNGGGATPSSSPVSPKSASSSTSQRSSDESLVDTHNDHNESRQPVNKRVRLKLMWVSIKACFSWLFGGKSPNEACLAYLKNEGYDPFMQDDAGHVYAENFSRFYWRGWKEMLLDHKGEFRNNSVEAFRGSSAIDIAGGGEPADGAKPERPLHGPVLGASDRRQASDTPQTGDQGQAPSSRRH